MLVRSLVIDVVFVCSLQAITHVHPFLEFLESFVAAHGADAVYSDTAIAALAFR